MRERTRAHSRLLASASPANVTPASKRAAQAEAGADESLPDPAPLYGQAHSRIADDGPATDEDDRDEPDFSESPADRWWRTMGRSRARRSRGTSHGAQSERPLSR